MVAVDSFMKLPITNRLNYGCSIDMNPDLYEMALPCRRIIHIDEYRYNDISVHMKKNNNESQYKHKRPKKPRKNVIITPPPVQDHRIHKPTAAEVYENQVFLNESRGLTEKYELINKIMWKIFDRQQELKNQHHKNVEHQTEKVKVIVNKNFHYQTTLRSTSTIMKSTKLERK